MAKESWWNRMASWVKRRSEASSDGPHPRPLPNGQAEKQPPVAGHRLELKKLAYVKSRILRVASEGLEYTDENGIKVFIDFSICHDNFLKEVQGEGWINLKRPGAAERKYVGFRDSSAKPPNITLMTATPTRFEFPTPKPPEMVPGAKLFRRDLEDFREFQEFQRQLLGAGVEAIDMS